MATQLLFEAHRSGEHQLFSEKAHAKWHQQCQDSWKLVPSSAPYLDLLDPFMVLLQNTCFILVFFDYVYLSEKSLPHIWTSDSRNL